MKEKVAVLGASNRPDRYAYLALKMLEEHGHEPYPVNPQLKEIEGKKVYATLAEIPQKVDTLTMYVGRAISSKLAPEILKLRPKRVIFNPGSENPELAEQLTHAGVDVVEACTLVMLRTQQF